MKLTKLSEDDLAHLACAFFEYDELGDHHYIYDQIGDQLGIRAVAGEGYDSTVFRVCSLIVDYRDPMTAYGRVADVLSVVQLGHVLTDVGGVNNLKAVENALKHIGGHDALAMADSVRTIRKQHNKYDRRDNPVVIKEG